MIPWSQRWQQLAHPHAGWMVVLAAVGLTVMGIVANSTQGLGDAQTNYALVQSQWLVISLLAMILVAWQPPRAVDVLVYPAVALVVLLLFYLIIPGMPDFLVPYRNGARNWMNLYFMNFQPSELAKIVFVLALAKYLQNRDSYRTLPGLLVPFCIMLVPMAMIMRQPDLGTAILFPPVLFAMLLAAGARLRHVGTLAGLGLAGIMLLIAVALFLPANWQLLKDYHVSRIRATANLAVGGSEFDNTSGYQQKMAMTLVGAGGLTGQGKERSATLMRYNFLPESHNDMVFALIMNRWGMVGGITVLLLYALLLAALFSIAFAKNDPFVRLAVAGFASLIATQAFINIGMALGLIPIIGITLPFISYGGSSLLASFLMIGLAFSFAAQKRDFLTPPSFEYDRRS